MVIIIGCEDEQELFRMGEVITFVQRLARKNYQARKGRGINKQQSYISEKGGVWCISEGVGHP